MRRVKAVGKRTQATAGVIALFGVLKGFGLEIPPDIQEPLVALLASAVVYFGARKIENMKNDGRPVL